MVPDQIEKLWGQWTSSLTASYGLTLEHVKHRKLESAAEEFDSAFVPTVKILFTEAGAVGPARYQKMSGTWCPWSTKLYVLTRQTQDVLHQNDSKRAMEGLNALRDHFRRLREASDTRNVFDYAAALQQKLQARKTDDNAIRALVDALNNAPVPGQGPADQDAARKARAEIVRTVQRTFDGEGKLKSGRLNSLRRSVRQFNRSAPPTLE